jgi:hypothetical protein
MRHHQRIALRHPIELDCRRRQQTLRCQTRNISAGGLLVHGASELQRDDLLRIILTPREGDPLSLQGRVLRCTGNDCAIVFEQLSAIERQRLEQLLTPHWNGGSLLDGVISIAPWVDGNDLATWMRYTSLLSDWHPHPLSG